MSLQFQRFALIGGLTVTLCAAVWASQKELRASHNLPASPQAKTSQPATHFTQGTITSINADQVVITRTVRGKAEQVTFAMNSQTQRTGNLAAGTRVSVQYHASDNQNVAAAVRELPTAKAPAKGKNEFKPKSKS